MASPTPPHVEAASTLAVIASSNEPLLFLARDLSVIAASASFCRAFQIDPASVPGRQLSQFGAELVINALKHAFPGQRPGKIIINYRAAGPNWTLLVEDDGVGMPSGENSAKPGLGTGIVEALARKLDGQTRVVDAKPGTAVTIVHTEGVGRGGGFVKAA